MFKRTRARWHEGATGFEETKQGRDTTSTQEEDVNYYTTRHG